MALKLIRTPKPEGPQRHPESTFAIHDEGDGIFSLNMFSCSALFLAEFIAQLDLSDAIIDVTPRWGLSPGRPLNPKLLLFLDGPLEVLQLGPSEDIQHLRRCLVDASKTRKTFLANVHDALQHERSFALSLSDDDHGVFYTRDKKHLAVALHLYLGGLLSDSLGDDAPTLSLRTASHLCEAVHPSHWINCSVKSQGKYLLCNFHELSGATTGLPSETKHQWVAHPQGDWLHGWTW